MIEVHSCSGSGSTLFLVVGEGRSQMTFVAKTEGRPPKSKASQSRLLVGSSFQKLFVEGEVLSVSA